MSSSLSPPPPSDDGPFEAVRPSPARPTSVLKHRSYIAMEEMRAESSTAHLKRQRQIISSPDSNATSPRSIKRFREPTPLYEDSALNDETPANASTAPATTANTGTGTTNSENIGYVDMDEEERLDIRPKSSDKDAPSVLFSEQLGTRPEPTIVYDDHEGLVHGKVRTMNNKTAGEEKEGKDNDEEAFYENEESDGSEYYESDDESVVETTPKHYDPYAEQKIDRMKTHGHLQGFIPEEVFSDPDEGPPIYVNPETQRKFERLREIEEERRNALRRQWRKESKIRRAKRKERVDRKLRLRMLIQQSAVDNDEELYVDNKPIHLSGNHQDNHQEPHNDLSSPPAMDVPSPSPSQSDPDGQLHFHRWAEAYELGDRLSDSDGLEPLDDYIQPTWKQFEAHIRDHDEAWHFGRYSRKVARAKKLKYEPGSANASEVIVVQNKPRTTRELWEEHLLDGDELKSYHSGDSEDFLMNHRPPLERAGIKRDIKLFTESMSALSDAAGDKKDYQVVDRLGEGTFSSVYLAYDRRHGKYYNEWWTGSVDSTKRSNFQSNTHKVKLALKRVLATSSPQRIENELDILESLRGCRNVSQLVTAFRQEDQVIIVLPYHQSDDFRHFYRHIDGYHMMRYMRCLLQALADIHRRGIIHRDVKPANFLFDYEQSTGVLCDFGLAERYVPPRKPTCQHAPATLYDLGGTRTKTTDTPAVEQAVYDARKRSKLGEGRIGFPQDDKRSAIKTNRAGTRGFRAPEVLLKCPDQTVSIDVWSAGVMLLSMLTHKFPVFNSSDDIEALMEIAAIFGRNAMEKCAMLHNRTIMSNVPTVDQSPPNLTDLVLTLNPHLYTPPHANPTREEARKHIEAMDHALDLCSKLLKLDATKRLTAKAALHHQFFHDPIVAFGEDSGLPILRGVDGKCGHLHSVEDGKHQAWFYKDCQEMQFGQGIPRFEDALCPEHEHWQQRTLLNPISTSRHFEVDPQPSQSQLVKQEPVEDRDQLEVEPPVLTVRDQNVLPAARTGRQKQMTA